MKRAQTNQELLDRYIHSLKTMLPAAKAEDIATEIRSNLESLADDRAAELGRELSLEEMSALLKQRGHPVLVAIPYLDPNMRGLISPVLFPLYWFTLRAIFGAWVTIRLIVAVFVLQGTATAGSVLPGLGRDILFAAFFIGGGVTLLFALWEYMEFKFRYSERWKPESLPPVPPPIRRPQPPRPMVRVAHGALWIVFLALMLFVPGMAWLWGGRGVFSPSDTVYAMRLPIWLLALCGSALSWIGYTRFAAAEWRTLLRIAVNVAGIALSISVLRAGNLLVAGPNWDSSQAKPLATLNQMTEGILVVACIIAALQCVRELHRFVRKSGGRTSRDRQTA